MQTEAVSLEKKKTFGFGALNGERYSSEDCIQDFWQTFLQTLCFLKLILTNMLRKHTIESIESLARFYTQLSYKRLLSQTEVT